MGLLKFKKAMNSMRFDRLVSLHGSDIALEKFVSYSPVGFCIDKDDAEHLAVRTIFPQSLIVLCHYHCMVIFINEARAHRHGLLQEDISKLMNLLRKLCASTATDMFTSILNEISTASPSFFEYLSKNFLNSRWKDTFSEVFRQHLQASVIRLCRSNMLVEVSFKTLKYVILGGFHNKRLDDLIYIISYRVFPYFISRQGTDSRYTPRFHITKSSAEEGSLLFK